MAPKEKEPKKKILIIDDEAVNRALLEDYLGGLDYEIHQAKDGGEGIQMLVKTSPDLVLLDINMPGKDGFQTLTEIKNTPGYSEIPVLFLTSYDRANLKVKGLELGADDYITRPFDKAELLARIRTALRRSRPCPKEGHYMAGNLGDLGLSELLQPFELGKKTAWLRLLDIDGEIVLEKGALVYARQGSFTGEDALDRVFLRERGKYIVIFNEIPSHIPKQPVQLMKAIMKSVAYIDEVKSWLMGVGPDPGMPPPQVIITPDILKLKGAEKFGINESIPVTDLAAALEGNLKEIAQALLKMRQEGKLQLGPGT